MIGWPKNIWVKSKGEVNANVMKRSCHVSPADVLTPDPWFILFCCLSPLSPLFIKTALRFSQAVLNVNMGNKKENYAVTASSKPQLHERAECVMKCKGSPVKDCIQCYNHTSLHPGLRFPPLGLLYLHQHLNTLDGMSSSHLISEDVHSKHKNQETRWDGLIGDWTVLFKCFKFCRVKYLWEESCKICCTTNAQSVCTSAVLMMMKARWKCCKNVFVFPRRGTRDQNKLVD